MHNFKELKVWQKAMDLAVEINSLMQKMPKEEMSVPSNIAEEAGRSTTADFARFIDISNGSTNELESQLILANRLQFLSNNDVEAVFPAIESLQKMNYNLLKNLRK